MTKLIELYKPKIMTSPFTHYSEYRPAQQLLPYVCCYWSSIPKKHIHGKKSYSFTVIPDGCTDILFEYDDEMNFCNIRYCGIFGDYFEVDESISVDKRTFGIRFFPGGARHFFQHKAMETSQQIVGLNELASGLFKGLQDMSHHLHSVNDMIAACNRVLSFSLSTRSSKNDALLNNVLDTILCNQGMVSVQEICEAEVVDSRRLQRLFEHRIGLSPKKFSQVIRFQSTLSTWMKEASTSNPQLTNNPSYYDQSHFIKDFKKRVGKTPSQLKMSDFYNTRL